MKGSPVTVTVGVAENTAVFPAGAGITPRQPDERIHLVNEYGKDVPCDSRALEMIHEMKKQMKFEHGVMAFILGAVLMFVAWIAIIKR